MSAAGELRDVFRMRILQMTVLASLFAFVVWRSFVLKLAVRDLDNWWHLKVGEWILHNHSFPHTGIFSATAANRPWAAYSWGYEVMLSLAYKWFDIVGMAVFGTILTVLVAASVFRLTQRVSGRFWTACVTSTAACSIFLFTMCPRPVYFSMIWFAAELALILEANRTGSIRPLHWLPLIFVVWANLHIQFIYGLAIVGLLLGVNLGQRFLLILQSYPEWLSSQILPSKPLLAIAAACFLAPCLSPYSYHLYGIIYDYANAKVPYQMIREMQPLTFQVASHYVQVLLTGAAFFALGRRRQVDLFKLAMLVLATIVGYRMMRDSWFLCITAGACIADSSDSELPRQPSLAGYEWAGLAVVLILAGVLFARDTNFNRAGLDAKVSSIFPVNAANYLRQHPQPGPLYNAFDWGGFLIWYMPDYPVAIDGRTDLYGDELCARFLATGSGDDSYLTDPYLNKAGVVLLMRDMPLATLLQSDGRFQRFYEDQLSAMFIRKVDGEGMPASTPPVVFPGSPANPTQ